MVYDIYKPSWRTMRSVLTASRGGPA
jgi:hypothetical protein